MKEIKDKMLEQDFVMYCITEEQALSVASEWTRFAKGENYEE